MPSRRAANLSSTQISIADAASRPAGASPVAAHFTYYYYYYFTWRCFTPAES